MPDDDDDDIVKSDGLVTIIAGCQIDDAGHISCSGCIERQGKGANQPPTLAAAAVIQHLETFSWYQFLIFVLTSVDDRSASPLNPPDTISICKNVIAAVGLGVRQLL